MENESVGRTLYDLIGGFFRRDLSYIVGGGLFVLVLSLFGPYGWVAALNSSLPFSLGEDHGWFAVVVWTVAFYVLGFVISETGDLLGIINKRLTLPAGYPTQGGGQILFFTKNQNQREALKIHERTIGFMHMSSSAGLGLVFALAAAAFTSGRLDPGIVFGTMAVLLGLAARWYVRVKLAFRLDTVHARTLSLTGDLIMVIGVICLASCGLGSFVELAAILFGGSLCIGLSRHFSREIIRERTLIDTLTQPRVVSGKTGKLK